VQAISQPPTDSDFVQNPYPFYDRARALGDLVYWTDYDLPVATSFAAVNAILKDRRMGREAPPGFHPEIPTKHAPFYAVEAHSMLEAEPPRHTRLRGSVLRAFTGRRINILQPEIQELTNRLIDVFAPGGCDLLDAFARPIPVIVIARFLGIPETMTDDLLRWSNAMVGMYQAGRTAADENLAIAATNDFGAFLRDFIAMRQKAPQDELISHLIAISNDKDAEEPTLSPDEVISTVILLLNAGHEATVHSLGNAVKTLLETNHRITRDNALAVTEETMRFDPPLHMFTRWVYQDIEIFGQNFRPGDRIGCLLGSANRDPQIFGNPHLFDPTRKMVPNAAFGAGIHFCLGAPLARLELRTALPILFQRLPDLALKCPARYADIYHFHGLRQLDVTY